MNENTQDLRGISLKSTSKRGFASMDKEKQRQIASKGGKTAHEKGAAYKFDSAKAREAGRIGGAVVSENREYMAEIGRRGGEISRGGRGAKKAEATPQFDEDLQTEIPGEE